MRHVALTIREDDLDAVFDESAYTKHVDVVFDRLHQLVKEPVHA